MTLKSNSLIHMLRDSSRLCVLAQGFFMHHGMNSKLMLTTWARRRLIQGTGGMLSFVAREKVPFK